MTSTRRTTTPARRTARAALALALACALGATTAGPTLAAAPSTPVATTSAAAPAGEVEDGQAVLERVRELVPERSPRAAALDAALGLDRPARTAQLERLVEGGPAECTDTALHGWLQGQLAGWTESDLVLLSLSGALDWPTYEALLTQPDGPQSFGTDGRHTRELQKTFRALQGFWDVDGSDIRLAALHGSVIMDDSRMVPVVSFAYGIPTAQAQQLVDLVQGWLAQDRFRGGDHPYFSFNAFAYSEAGAAPEQRLGLPDKIIMGDGILEGMEAIGLGDVAPRGILAHEYGHHVQYELGLFDGHAGDAEATRRSELEADALGGYYLSHPRGERLRQQRVEAFVRSFGEVGDCAVDSAGHHGTPDQRSAAARWADQLVEGQRAKGQVLPAATVSDLFRAALPRVLGG